MFELGGVCEWPTDADAGVRLDNWLMMTPQSAFLVQQRDFGCQLMMTLPDGSNPKSCGKEIRDGEECC